MLETVSSPLAAPLRWISKPLLAAALVWSLGLGGSNAQEFMTQAELLATIPGRTIQSKTNDGTAWAQAYSSGKKRGSIKGVLAGESFAAKWYVEGDKWCENWGEGHACWSVERVDQNSLRMYDDKGKPRKNLWKIQG